MILIITENISERERASTIHWMPLDTVNGIRDSSGRLLTVEELEQIGILVENIPEEPPKVDGKIAIPYVNCYTKEVWYEYEDIQALPLTPEQRITQLEQAILELSMLIAQTGGAD